MRITSLPRLFLASALGLAILAGFGTPMASAQVLNRIAKPVTNSSYVAIPGSVHPRAKLATDLGPAPEDKPLTGMSIRFNMTDAQQAALDQLLADQQNPSSPRYHQWLTPSQYAAQFGLSSSDLAKVSAWLSAQGLKVTGIANGGTFITFDGTVAQVQDAFATSIHNLSLNGEAHFANVTNISVPSALGGVVSAVTGLHNFRLKPRVHTSVVNPHFTSSISGDHFIAPGDIYTMYNVTPLLNSSITGAGQTIAVTGQTDIYPADVLAFRSASGLSTTNLPTTIYAGTNPGYASNCTNNNCPSPSQGDLAESSIDVEWSGAMAPSATIDFVTGVDVMANSMTYAIDNDLAPIVTTSYGLCEAGWGSMEMLSLNALFKQANAQGQTVLAASADYGATDCDLGPTATEGLTVDFPGSSPYVTSMGGTMLNDGNATGATTYWSGSNGTTGGSALSYIPESVWNDESSIDAFGGGGGGASAFFTKPAWQTGTGVPADGSRDVPDLSLDGSDAHDPLLFCVNTAAAEGSESCTNGFRVANNDLNTAGGTSFDSQIFGGLLALVEQKIGSKIGNANPTIYALANSNYYAAGQNTLTNSTVVFNDVTAGNNAMPCAAGSPNCGNGGAIGFNAGTGYDPASGWGSVNVANMANDWPLVTPLGVGTLGPNISATSLTATPSSVAVGATVTLTATVTGSAGTPTGNVQFLANNVALDSPVALSGSGTASYSWITSCSNLGQQVMSASYSGDTNYQGSKGPQLTVGGENSNGVIPINPVEVQVTSSTCPDFSLSASSSSFTVASGGTIPSATITVAAVNNFTGTVMFSADVTSSSGYAPTVTFSPASVNISSSAPVTTTLTLSGITASLQLPNRPGEKDLGTMLAQHNGGKAPWYAEGSGAVIGGLLLLALPRRRRLGGLLLAALAVALIGGATGCSSSQAGPPTTTTPSSSTNPYVGTYDVTVIATYTNSSTGQVTQHSTGLVYTIN